VEITLQSLLDAIADGGDLAALLRQYTTDGELSAEQVTSLITEARASFDTLRPTVANEADLERLETIADAITALGGESTHLAEQVAARDARVAEIAARAGVETPADGEGDDAAAEGEGDAAAEGEGAGDLDIANAPVEDLTETAATGEQLAASSAPATRTRRRVSLADVARRAQPTPPPATPEGDQRPMGGSLVASAEAQGIRGGHMFASWEEVGEIAAGMIIPASPSSLMASAVAAGRSGNEFYQRTGIVQLRRDYDPELVVKDPGADSTKLLKLAADPDRIPGGAEALTAALGWCAPSETLYDLCELPCALEGILSTPEISAPRGGVRWTKGLDFCDIYNAAGYFHYTEAEMEVPPPNTPVKPCMTIPCVDFDECRLEVDGMCITGDIPQARAYPEIVAQFLQGATCARAHRTNALKIGRIAAGSQNDGVVSFAPMGATASVLNAIDLKIMEYRYRGLRSQSGNAALLEMPLPFWLRGVIRGDLANRNGYDNPFEVTDADIERWFRSRGVIVRWVYDWQPLPAVCATPPAAPITAWPTTVEIILYEVGTWVFATQDVISIENLYDSTLIRNNQFTALFVEDAFCLINRCNGSLRFQVPICPSGNTGAQPEFTCPPGLAPFSEALVAAEVRDALRQRDAEPSLPDGFALETEAEADARRQRELEQAQQAAAEAARNA
jgi:hypothetical protein